MSIVVNCQEILVFLRKLTLLLEEANRVLMDLFGKNRELVLLMVEDDVTSVPNGN